MAPPQQALDRVRAALAHPAVWIVCVVLGVAVASPAVGSGLLADDVGQRAFILAKLGGETELWWWDMFVLVGQTPAELERLRFVGVIPWWSSTQVHVAFWRPLTAATHYLDYAMWPERPALMHLHQLLWHGLACGLAWSLFRRLASSKAAAGAAGLGFALTHLHLSATAWLAHRNGVLVLVFAALTMLAHDRWRRDGWSAGAVLGPIAFTAALLAGEMGVAVLGFVVAHALTLDRAALTKRALAVLPYLLIVVVWRLVYDALGYGATGSGIYIDPLAEPLRWLALAPARMLELLIYALGPPGPIGAGSWWRIAGALIVTAAVLTAALGRRDRDKQDTPSVHCVLRFAGLSLVLGLIPLTATAPHDRVLVLATLATTLAFGELVGAALDQPHISMRVGALIVVLCHGLLSPLAAIGFASQVDQLDVAGGDYPTAATLDDTRLRQQSLVIVHSPSPTLASLLPRARVLAGLQRPNFTWLLHAEANPPTVRRVGPKLLELDDPEGWARGPETHSMRSTAQPFAVGDRIETLDFIAEVLTVDDGRPTRVRFELRAPLEDPSFAVVSWAQTDFERVELPLR